MVATHLHNTATPDYQVQAHILYHWLTFVNQFTAIEASGANWTPIHFSSSTGVVNSTTPSAFYDVNAVFDSTFLNKHIAIRDAANAENCFIAEITAVVSPTRVNLDSSAVLNVSSTDVEYVVFDTAAPPAAGDYFVIETKSTVGPAWQARCSVNASPAALEWQLGFIGGWDVGSSSWILPVSTSHWLPTTVTRTFCVADSGRGYLFLWSEGSPGGAAGDRNAIWMGSLVPYHSPAEIGVPKDIEYSAIFGSTTSPGPSTNLSRDTTVSDNFVVGEMLSQSGTVINAYVAQKRLLSSGTDMLAVAAAATNPRSVQIDSYSADVFLRAPNMAWRGRLPGVRILNDSVANRTPINGNNTYVIGNGIGVSWNGKAPQP